jgi:transglutaminase-like putative cysteine protease
MVEAIGLKARIVGGAVFMEATGDMEPHQWAEVFIPEVGKWGLMDPSFNKAIIYPSRRYIYYMESYVAPEDPSLKLTVSAQNPPNTALK